eukprot:SAG22_NODE_525_length_9470_cov_21.475936_5_plen_143_part_00
MRTHWPNRQRTFAAISADVDECATENNECQAFFEGLRECVNTEGSYECGPCAAGYREDPETSFCIDIDECTVPAQLYCGHSRVASAYVDITAYAASYGGVPMVRSFSPQLVSARKTPMSQPTSHTPSNYGTFLKNAAGWLAG